MANRSKYAFDKHYYNGLYRQSFNGNAVKKIDLLEELEEEELEDELLGANEADYAEPSQHYERHIRVENEREVKIKVHRRIDVNVFYMITMIAAVCVLLASAFKMLETRSDITQTEKKIAIAKTELADINALNESLKASLDTQLDRNYIYSMAVGKLGMGYPNNNKVLYYEPSDNGYVKQLSVIP